VTSSWARWSLGGEHLARDIKLDQLTPGYSITSSARPSSVIGETSFPLLVDYGCAARSAARTMRLTFLIAK